MKSALIHLIGGTSVLALVGTAVWALDYPTEPYKHALWDKAKVTKGECRTEGAAPIEFWTADGRYVSENHQRRVCAYTCEKGHAWTADETSLTSSNNGEPIFFSSSPSPCCTSQLLQ